MNQGSNTSNHHPLPPRDDRETLSALFDGELPGDAARFALKRLDHDAGWRDTCGRWQLIGDALRGEATSAAPADFAAGVMRKLAAEGMVSAAASPASPVIQAAPGVARRRWIGGAALAASVAMVAVLVARPFSPSPTSAPAQVADGAVVVPAVAPVRMTTPGGPDAQAAAPAASSAAAALSAVADASSASSAPVRRVARPARATQPPVSSPASDDTARVVATADTTAVRKPFHPSVDEVATRPWPRAVLPDAAGAFSVGFDPGATPTSSYYPFEPRLPEAAATKPPSTEPQN